MPKMITVKSKEFFPLIHAVMANGQTARITITGRSMYPFLREHLDSVELAHADFTAIKRGDIVLIVRDNDEYVLHRVVRKKKDSFYLVGDGQVSVEGPIRPDQLLARVKKIWRGGREVNSSSVAWCCTSHLWLYCLLFRRVAFKMHSVMKFCLRF